MGERKQQGSAEVVKLRKDRMKWTRLTEKIDSGVWLCALVLFLRGITRIHGFSASSSCSNSLPWVVNRSSNMPRRSGPETTRHIESQDESGASSKLETTSSRSLVLSLAAQPTYMSLFDKLNDLYASTSSIRCPFFRRRFSDIIDALAMIGRFLIIRHKSLIDPASLDLSLLPQIPGCLPPMQANGGCTSGRQHKEIAKLTNLPVEQVAALVGLDWDGKKKGARKGYYITGKLNTLLYENDCLFDGPDPDMPVRGLRKYLSAASHLFDHNQSYAEILDLTYDVEKRTVTARWKLGGVLMLPWRPKVKDWTGSTTYHMNERGLIYLHQECWDISVAEAFISTAFPWVGKIIWG